MKRLFAALVCLVLLTTSVLYSCDGSSKNEEVEEGSVWKYSGVGEIEVLNENKSQSFVNGHVATIKSYYTTIYNLSNPQSKSDYISFKDGKVTYLGFAGVGNPSFVNGISVYSSIETEPYQIDFGTYSGSEITIVDVNEEIVDAYIREGTLILIHEDSTVRMEILFEKTNEIGLTE